MTIWTHTEVAPPPDETRVLTPLERLELLCDPGSLQVIRSRIRATALGAKAVDGDGVVGATGTVAGRQVFCYAQDSRFVGGSLGRAHADTIVRVLRLAGDVRAPVVSFIESAGARVQEGSTALGGYANVFRENVRLSGRVPQISVITGTAAGGGGYSPALTDFVVMTKGSTMFLTGPDVVRAVTGEDVTAAELGGDRVHARNGVCQFVADTVVDAVGVARALLSYLPRNAWEPPPVAPAAPPVPGAPDAPLPAVPSKVYDVRDVIARIVDGDSVLEVAPRWGRNMVTAFARLDGRPVGVVANQPHYIGGVIDAVGAEKGARFVRICNGYGLPLVVLVDTPGFLPGTTQETAGIIRRGAKLLYAFAEAEVPKLTVVLRQAYGGGFITMNCKELGADLAFAWPGARIGVLGATQAIEIAHRREIAAADDPQATRAMLADRYVVEQLDATVAAREGVVDELIHPAETRTRLIGALDAVRGKRRGEHRAGNIPC